MKENKIKISAVAIVFSISLLFRYYDMLSYNFLVGAAGFWSITELTSRVFLAVVLFLKSPKDKISIIATYYFVVFAIMVVRKE